jgi:hypothetical protein
MKLITLICLSLVSVTVHAAPKVKEEALRVDGNVTYDYFAGRPDLSLLENRDISSIRNKVGKIKVFNVQDFFKPYENDSNATLAKDLETWSLEGLEQLYARLSSGPWPFGDQNEIQYEGIAKLHPQDGAVSRVDELIFSTPFVNTIFGGAAGATVRQEFASNLAKLFWHGKVFRKGPGKTVHTLVNRIPELPALRLVLNKKLGEGENIQTQGGGLLSGTKEDLMAPAKVYCGQSILDSRKESFIIDYSYSESVPVNGVKFDNAQKVPAHRTIVGRNGLDIRDEIRMVRPGLYLGRAYAKRQFLLTFILHNDVQFKKPFTKRAIADACRNPYSNSAQALAAQ